jgi:hypothetical protein
MRKLTAVLTIVLLALVLTTTVAASSDQTRVLQNVATGSGTDWIPVLGGSTFIIGGTVHSNRFGRGSFIGQGTQIGPTSFTLTTVTLYRDGTLTQQATGSDTGTNTSTVQNIIVSGTGRFAGATGTSTVMSTTTPTLDPSLRTLRFVVSGTVTLAAS